MNFYKLIEKKEQLDSHRQKGGGLPAALVQNLDEWFKIELTYTSNAIEGNTLTRRETALVVEKGITVGGKSLIEHLEATNHAKALDMIHEIASRRSGRGGKVSEKEIFALHEAVLKGIDDAHAGQYRNVAVRISGSNVIMPNPVKVPDLMEEMAKWLNKKSSTHPIEFAAEAHYQLVTIHPFVDGNGRTARLLMNLILLMHGYPPAIIRKRDRLAYISSLEKAQLGGSKDDFLKIIAKSVDRSLNIYLKAINQEETDDEQPKQPRQLDDEALLKIGALAKQANETVATIRFWTKEGLLQIAETTPSNYALYSIDMIDQCKQIQNLKAKRYTLAEIKERLAV